MIIETASSALEIALKDLFKKDINILIPWAFSNSGLIYEQ